MPLSRTFSKDLTGCLCSQRMRMSGGGTETFVFWLCTCVACKIMPRLLKGIKYINVSACKSTPEQYN